MTNALSFGSNVTAPKNSNPLQRFGPAVAPASLGITLIELLVAMAILGIVLAITIVAVGSAREASRRLQCSNNLHQLGIGFQAYHTTCGSLPPAVTWSPPGEPLGKGEYPIGIIDRVARYGDIESDTIYANWAIMLLGHLDQRSLANQFNNELAVSDPANSVVRSTPLQVMRCPSDPFIEEPYLRGFGAGLRDNTYARGNYGLNVGPDKACVEGMPRADGKEKCVGGFVVRGIPLESENYQVWGTGMGGVNRSMSWNEVTDGLSNTVLLDEIRAGVDSVDPRGVWALGQIASSAVSRHGKYEGGRPNPTEPTSELFCGCDTLISRVGRGFLQSQGMDCMPVPLEESLNTQSAARSAHGAGGINVLMCDGSVKFIENAVDAIVWHDMHTREAGPNEESPQ